MDAGYATEGGRCFGFWPWLSNRYFKAPVQVQTVMHYRGGKLPEDRDPLGIFVERPSRAGAPDWSGYTSGSRQEPTSSGIRGYRKKGGCQRSYALFPIGDCGTKLSGTKVTSMDRRRLRDGQWAAGYFVPAQTRTRAHAGIAAKTRSEPPFARERMPALACKIIGSSGQGGVL